MKQQQQKTYYFGFLSFVVCLYTLTTPFRDTGKFSFGPNSHGWDLIFLACFFIAGVWTLLRHFKHQETLFSAMPFKKTYLPFLLGAAWILWAFIKLVIAKVNGHVTTNLSFRYSFYSFMDIFLLLPYGIYLGQRNNQKLLRFMAYCISVAFTLFGIFGLIIALTGHNFLDGFVVMNEQGRLLILGDHAYGAYMYFVAMLCGYYWLYSEQKKSRRIFPAICITVSFIVICFTDTRSTMALAAAIIILLFFLTFKPKKAHNSRLKAWSLKLGAIILVAIVLYGLYYCSRTSANALVQVTGLQAEDHATTSDFTSGRLYNWTRIIQHLITDPRDCLLGLTPYDAILWVQTNVMYEMWHPHNQFLYIWLSDGLPGLLLYGLCWLAIVIRGFKLWFSEKKITEKKILILFVFSCMALNMLAVNLSYNHNLMESTFWLIGGAITGMTKVNNKKSGT